MINLVQGNLLDARVEALVNTVNTVGVMGKGIALQFKRAYPENFEVYARACKRGEVEVGRMLTVPLNQLEYPRYLINFPTKDHWKGKSRLEYIESGLESLRSEVERLGIKSIAIPPLGCGLGGLGWPDVLRLIRKALGSLEGVDIQVFAPAGPPAAKSMSTTSGRPPMTAGRAAMLGLMQRYMAPLMDETVTLLEVHKLMYFVQVSGEPLRLKYVKGMYGPYAVNLRHVLKCVEGHYISGFGDASEEPGKVLELLPGTVDEAETFLNSCSSTKKHFTRVESLIRGFETAYGLELLGSVHWVASHEQARSVDDAVRLVHAWNPRKSQVFPREHIAVAWDRLSAENWV